ncbi:hypothetical protein Tco_1546432 [Tanacetum coccineum]
MDQVHISSSESTTRVSSSVSQVAPASKSNEIPERNPHQHPIPYPSRLNKDKLQDKYDIQIHKFLQMFKKLHFNITVFLKRLPKKLRDIGKFLIPCDFSELEECLALADLVAYLVGIAEDVFMQVGKFMFPVDFVVIEYDVDPRSTLKYPHKHGDESINQIDIIDTTCEEHFHEVLNVKKSIHPLSGSPTSSCDPVVASLSPSLTPFGDSNFLLEETDAFLALDDSVPPEIDTGIYDS